MGKIFEIRSSHGIAFRDVTVVWQVFTDVLEEIVASNFRKEE
jgi:hypothetical protein